MPDATGSSPSDSHTRVAGLSLSRATESVPLGIWSLKTPLFQSLSKTLYGPRYLGAKLPFPNAQSCTNTKSAVFNCFGINGEYSNFFLSITAGVNLRMLLLARSKSSRGVPDSLSDLKQSPGTLRGMQNSISAEEVAVSSLGAFLKPNSTHGNVSNQDLVVNAQHKAFFNILWNLSTITLAWGW